MAKVWLWGRLQFQPRGWVEDDAGPVQLSRAFLDDAESDGRRRERLSASISRAPEWNVRQWYIE